MTFFKKVRAYVFGLLPPTMRQSILNALSKIHKLRFGVLRVLGGFKALLENGYLENMLISVVAPKKSQLVALRGERLKSLVSGLPKEANVLEIGTWFGEGSTKLFIDGLSRRMNLVLLDTWCEYVSEVDLEKSFYRTMNEISYFAMANTLRVVRKAEQLNDSPRITVIRRSGDIDFFGEKTFDLVFIDGSHYYEDVKRDIQLALRVLKPGGTMCGDDLELQPTKELADFAKLVLNQDFVSSPKGDYFHPGVALAVYELLGEVEIVAGCWSKTVN